jgi:hypothetical protein
VAGNAIQEPAETKRAIIAVAANNTFRVIANPPDRERPFMAARIPASDENCKLQGPKQASKGRGNKNNAAIVGSPASGLPAAKGALAASGQRTNKLLLENRPKT